MMKFINTIGFNIFSDELSKISLENKKCIIINTMSPNSYGISTKDNNFRNALLDSDYLVLDGVYFALASIFLSGKNIKKNQGPEVFYHFMNRVNLKKGKVFFLGSSKETLNKIKFKAKVDYPNIIVETYSPPYKNIFSDEDNHQMIEAINTFSPDLLLVGMTCPKQEKWAYYNRKNLNSTLICCVGAVFDWYAGNSKPIAPIWWKLRLAWLVRTIQRPEIIKRYPNIGIFLGHLLLAFLGLKKYKYDKI